MKELKRILAAVLMGLMLSVGALAQKGNDNRPPKDPPSKVKEKEKPPPSNNNQNTNRRDKP